MGNLEGRLKRLEEQKHREHLLYEEWPLVEQIEDVYSYLMLDVRWGSRAACTDQQLRCLGLVVASWENPDTSLEDLSPVGLDDFPDEVREHVSRLDPRAQPERDAWLREQAGYFVRTLEELPADNKRRAHRHALDGVQPELHRKTCRGRLERK